MPSISLGKGAWYPWDVLQLEPLGRGPPNVTYGETGDAVCAPNSWPVINMSNPFVDAFRTPGLHWTVARTVDIEGRKCRVWQTAKMPGLFIGVADDGSPRLLVQGWYYSCLISKVTVGAIPDKYFEPTQACQNYPTAPCPGSGVVTLTLYRLHSGAEPLVLDDRDLGDALGAPSIICDWPTSGQSYVTSFEVTANSSWGQYGRCHFNGTNFCDAQTGKHVGRQSPQGLPGVPQQGQCSDNADRGSWYSFPASGRCRPGEAVGSGGCTWSARPLRTVRASCIEGWRFRAACQKEIGHTLNAAKSSAIIVRALASGNPLKGGCPAAKPGDADAAAVVVV